VNHIAKTVYGCSFDPSIGGSNPTKDIYLKFVKITYGVLIGFILGIHVAGVEGYKGRLLRTAWVVRNIDAQLPSLVLISLIFVTKGGCYVSSMIYIT
jgi:hypothetical protein